MLESSGIWSLSMIPSLAAAPTTYLLSVAGDAMGALVPNEIIFGTNFENIKSNDGNVFE